MEIVENKWKPDKPDIKLTFVGSDVIDFGHYNSITLVHGAKGTIIFDISPLIKELHFEYKDNQSE